MSDLEKICEDKTTWVCFNGGDQAETIGVYARCHCGRFLKHGKVSINTFCDTIKLEGWICSVHGEVEPYFDLW